MLIEADASGLEVVAAAFLSQDPVLCKEIRDGVDIHEMNQKKFNLPTRLVAKKFKFRIIYGGTKWSYAIDNDFNFISDKPEYWQGVIDDYYEKYQGIAKWHTKIVEEAMREGRLVMPTGRVYTYEPYFKRDQWVWPRTTILNYPVQGLGHELLAIARVSAKLRIGLPALHINTVHDSILIDCPDDMCYTVCSTLEQVFRDIPANFEKVFGVEFNLPMKAEVKFGRNWLEMEKYDKSHH